MNATATATELKTYPWSGYDFSDEAKVYATCPSCNWKKEISNKKDQAFFDHFDEAHSEQVVVVKAVK
jgi:hypothetical protein